MTDRRYKEMMDEIETLIQKRLDEHFRNETQDDEEEDILGYINSIPYETRLEVQKDAFTKY